MSDKDKDREVQATVINHLLEAMFQQRTKVTMFMMISDNGKDNKAHGMALHHYKDYCSRLKMFYAGDERLDFTALDAVIERNRKRLENREYNDFAFPVVKVTKKV